MRIYKVLLYCGLISMLLLAACSSTETTPMPSEPTAGAPADDTIAPASDEQSVEIPVSEPETAPSTRSYEYTVNLPMVVSGDSSNDQENQREAAIQAVKAALAQLKGVSVDQVEVIQVEAVDWPDTCLGIPIPDTDCSSATIPGYRLIIGVSDETFEYRSNIDGSSIGLYQP